MSEYFIKDNKVAVIISPGYGAGWYTWNNNRQLLFDPTLVDLVLNNANPDLIRERAEQIEPGGYFSTSDLCVEWVECGSRFRVSEYDGSERLILIDDESYIQV